MVIFVLQRCLFIRNYFACFLWITDNLARAVSPTNGELIKEAISYSSQQIQNFMGHSMDTKKFLWVGHRVGFHYAPRATLHT
jgi:hypothetical protein